MQVRADLNQFFAGAPVAGEKINLESIGRLDVPGLGPTSLEFVEHCGFESVSRDALVEANKKNRPSEYKELVARAHEHGISIESSFIFGFDHDRPDVFDETVDTLHEIEVDLANFFVLTPFPGTHTFARYYEEGRILDFDWGHYNSYTPVVEPENMSVPELREGLMRAYRKFYSGASQRRRFSNGLRFRDPVWSMNYFMINRSYGKVYRNPPQTPRQPAFQAHRDDLEALLTTSRAEAQDAITVAASALPAAPVSLSIGPSRRSEIPVVSLLP